MTTRRLVTPASLAALLLALGCTASLDAPREKAEAPTEEKPKGDQPHIAPMPRVRGEKPPIPALPVVWTPAKSTKPWSELVVGKWLQVHRHPRYSGQRTYEYTRDGKEIARLIYFTTPNRPKEIDVSTQDYRVNDKVIEFPSLPPIHDDGIWVWESTLFIESLTEYEMVTLAVTRKSPEPRFAKEAASALKIPVEKWIADQTEITEGRGFFVRLKNK